MRFLHLAWRRLVIRIGRIRMLVEWSGGRRRAEHALAPFRVATAPFRMGVIDGAKVALAW
jgi:hypothetical protein